MIKVIKIIKIIIFTFFVYSSILAQDSIIINKNTIRDNLKYLASDELKGRFPGTEGIENAAKFIEEKFKTFGLKNFNNSYRQEFLVTTALKATENNSVVFENIVQRVGLPENKWPRMKMPWVLGKDFSPLSFSENGKASGEVAFVGFGITAPELNYDDYEGIDVNGKVVIIISDSPDGERKEGQFSRYSDMRYKATNAKNRGASGIIMIRIQGDSMNVFERLEYVNFAKNSGIIAVQAQRQSLTKFFPKNKVLIELEDSIVKYKKPKSFVLPNVTVEINVDLEDIKSPTYNIIGYVEGTDEKLKDEYIVIGAHYDHLGYGGPTSRYKGMKEQIHNGADDNASGVVGLIELASYFANNPTKRSIVFASFSAEEMGLLGSSYFVKNSPMELNKIITMINLDMIGRFKNELTIFGYNTGSSFEKYIDSFAVYLGLKTVKATDAYGPSDHMSFYIAKIPVMMIFTGIHEDYHKPSDDWDKINYDGMIKIINFNSKLIKSIANDELRPVLKEIKMESTEHRSTRDGQYSNVYFGIIPGFEESPLGCKINGATPGSPADKAGLKPNDIITEMNNTKIKNLYDFMYKLRELNPGDKVEVKYIRDDKEYKTIVEVVAKTK